MPYLASIGMTALPPDLRAGVERLPGPDEETAAAVRGQVRMMAGLLEGCGNG